MKKILKVIVSALGIIVVLGLVFRKCYNESW